jgi:hypothetical protein
LTAAATPGGVAYVVSDAALSPKEAVLIEIKVALT